MANKNFEVKHGLSVGGTERITSAGAGSFTDLSLSGNLTVTGSTTTADNLVSADKNITLNYHASNDTSGSADGAGITIQDAVNSSTDATILWDATNDDWKISHDLQIPTKIRHTGDLDTYISFANPDDFRIVVGNSTRAAFNTSKIHFNQEGINQDFQVEGQGSGNENLLYVDASGNKIGIGTASPLDLVHLNSSSGDVRMLMNAPTDSDVEIKYSENGTVKYTTGYDAGIDSFVIGTTNVDTNRRLVIDSTGNIGIGTDTPKQWASYTDNAATVLNIKDSSQRARIVAQGEGAHLDLVDSGGGSNDKHLNFSVDGGIGKFGSLTDAGSTWVQEHILIMDLGNARIGLGTTTPASMLHIKGGGDAIRVESTNTGAGGAQMDLLHFTTSPADEDVHGAINFGGYYSGTTSAYGSAIRSVWTDVSAKEGRLEFYTRDDSDFPANMTIDHTGDVLVGSSTNLNVLSGTPKMQIGDGSGHSSLQFYSGTGSVGALYFGDATSGGGRYPGYIEYRHNNDTMAFQVSDANSMILREDRLDVCTGTNEARITINNVGTPGTNSSNWIRASDGVLMYNSATSDHRWEIGGTQHMILKATQSDSTAMLRLDDHHPWIDLVAPDGGTWKGGITVRGGASSTQAQVHFHMTRNASYRTLSTAGDYDAYIDTTTANAAAYGDFLIGTDNVEALRVHASGQEVSIGNSDKIGSSAKTYLAVGSLSGSSTLSICSSTSGYGYLNFADGTSGAGADPGYIRYNHNDNTFLVNREFSGDLNDTSDEALKENIVDLVGGTSIIKQLKPRSFDWKTDEHGGKTNRTGRAGFIAQEVDDVLPNEVVGEDGEKSINVTGIVAHLVKTVQELEARIATLEG